MARRRASIQGVVVILLCTPWLGCQAPQRYERAAGLYTAYEGEQGQQHHLCAFGKPEKEDGWDFGPTVEVERPGYLLEHSSQDKVALWVCEHVKKEHLEGDAKRRNNFKAEPRLPSGDRAELADYSGSGYDRGHMAPAADFKDSQDRMDESFFLSNMAPQIGIGFNRHIWGKLEEHVREAAKNRGAVFVITGGMFYDPDEESRDTADGFVEYDVIGPNEVSVPTHFYKIVAANKDNEWEAIGFVLENRAYPRVPGARYDFEPFLKAIDWIEDRSGINFMPLLDEDNPDLEERLERNPADLWPAFRNN